MKDKLTQWLEKQGFSLEIRAASAFRKAGFEVKQSAHYHDRGQGKDREIDVIAVRRFPNAAPLVHFTIECKSSEKPWVVLTSPETLSGIDRHLCWGILTHEAIDTFSTTNAESLENLPWYSTSDECGYGFRKAFADRDDAFAASIVACKAAQYLVLPMQADRRKLPPYAVAFPIIVVDSPLFECRLTTEGNLELTQVVKSEFLFEDHLMFDAWVRVRVVHIDELASFAGDAYAAASEIHQVLTALPPPRTYEEMAASGQRSES